MSIKQNIAVFILSVFLIVTNTDASDYYVDATNGNDENSGLQVQPWKSIDRVNQETFWPGDNIYFKRGELWREQLIISQQGTVENPITYAAYGDGNRPIITPTEYFDKWTEYSIIKNAGFEIPGSSADDLLLHWNEYIDNSIVESNSYIKQSTDIPLNHEGYGDFSAEIYYASPASNAYISQQFSMQENTEYYFSFSSKVSSGESLRCMLRMQLNDGTYRWLNSDQQWQDTHAELNFLENNWSDHSFNLPATPLGSNIVKIYFLHGKNTNSSVWVDRVVFSLKDSNQGKVWEGYVKDLKYSWGALRNSQRIFTYPPYPRVDLMTLRNDEFHSPLNSYLFYYRNDDGFPSGLEVGVKKNGIFVTNASHIHINDIDVFGPTGVGPNDSSGDIKDYSLIRVENSDAVLLRNMVISKSFSVGALFSDGTSNSELYNVKIYDHSTSCVYFSVAGNGNRVLDSEIFACGNLDSDYGDMALIGVWQTPGVHIENCYVYDNAHSVHDTVDAGISVVQSPNAVIRRNTVRNTGGVAIQFAEWSDNSETSYNIIDMWAIFGIKYGEGLRIGGGKHGIDPQTGLLRTACLNCKIFNNLFINGGIMQGEWGALAFLRNLNHSNVQVKNNIFYNNVGIYEIKVEDKFPNSTYFPAVMDGAVFSNNLFYRTEGNAIRWHGDVYAFDKIIGSVPGYYSYDINQEEGSIAVDPLLVDPASYDYSLSFNSPAIDAGIYIGLDHDLYGNQLAGLPDMGVFEHQDADNDGLGYFNDNCPYAPNTDQSDLDNDGIGDVCDTDADGDGYINLADCNDLNSLVYPGALEISYDQIDQNCDGSDATIVVLKAVYKSRKDKLVVRATSELGSNANLSIDAIGPMVWKARKEQWQFAEENVGGKPEVIIITGVEGSIQSPVQ